MNHDTYRHFSCGVCRKLVPICRCCDRGQRYCPGECQESARRVSVRRAKALYQATRQGARLHACRQAAYVRRLREKVTDQGPLPELMPAMLTSVAPDRPDEASDTPTSGSAHPPKDLVACAFCGHLCAPYARWDFILRR